MRRSDVAQILTGLRELAVTMIPSSSPTPPCIFDAEAEAELLTSWWEGFWSAEQVDSDDFYVPLYRGVAEVLITARGLRINPTLGLVLRGLAELGIRGAHLETAVASLLECHPLAVHPGAAARRVSALAWRRRAVAKLDRLRALLVDASTHDPDIEKALDSLVEIATLQPSTETP